MDYLHPAFALALFGEAFAVLWFIHRWLRIEPVAGHAPEIDGLRGLLAFGVFVHHASIWYFFLKTGQWVAPESRLYAHLGQTTVSLFFMITGFLFFGKLLDGRSTPIDWLRLYVSRSLRILPLYLLVMLVGAAVIVFIRHSGWVAPLEQPWSEKSLVSLFTAGVTWTLAYECQFYFALPLLGLLFGRVPLPWLFFSAVVLYFLDVAQALDIHALTFLGGALAVALAHWAWWQKLACSAGGSLLALLSLVVTVMGFDTAYAWWPQAWLTLSFCLIANGAGLWGLLKTALSRVFGEITYSIYLLHGPLLFVFFRLVLDFETAAQLTPLTYWLTIAALVPVLLVISTLSFRCVEKPAMRKVSPLTTWLRGRSLAQPG